MPKESMGDAMHNASFSLAEDKYVVRESDKSATLCVRLLAYCCKLTFQTVPDFWLTANIANGSTENEKKGKKRPLVEQSFFMWFSEAQEDDQGESLQDEIAEIIKEDLWPNPLKYFNNEADEKLEGEEGEEGSEGEDGEEEEEEEEGEGDDEE